MKYAVNRWIYLHLYSKWQASVVKNWMKNDDLCACFAYYRPIHECVLRPHTSEFIDAAKNKYVTLSLRTFSLFTNSFAGLLSTILKSLYNLEHSHTHKLSDVRNLNDWVDIICSDQFDIGMFWKNVFPKVGPFLFWSTNFQHSWCEYLELFKNIITNKIILIYTKNSNSKLVVFIYELSMVHPPPDSLAYFNRIFDSFGCAILQEHIENSEQWWHRPGQNWIIKCMNYPLRASFPWKNLSCLRLNVICVITSTHTSPSFSFLEIEEISRRKRNFLMKQSKFSLMSVSVTSVHARLSKRCQERKKNPLFG